MAVNLTNADKALKTYYLEVVAEQLNKNANPLLSAISQTTNDVWGKEIRKLAIYGVNGGIGAGTEEGSLPTSNGNKYENFVLPLKNLYGTIEISDKAIRASENNAGAFVNLLNAEMEGLIKSSSFNFGRMLFGDGSGVVGEIYTVADGCFYLKSGAKNIVEGMIVDIRSSKGALKTSGLKINFVDRDEKFCMFEQSTNDADYTEDDIVVIQGSYNNELTGLKAIFGKYDTLYGVDRNYNGWMVPYMKQDAGEISELDIQIALDAIEERSGSSVNFIVCSMGVRRALQKLFSQNRRNIDIMELQGGYKAMSYNGIPIVADRFCDDGTMYLLNTNDFALHQLCDWQWLEGEDGTVLKQVAGKPVYTATLVKYADLLCSKPCGQGMITGITEA